MHVPKRRRVHKLCSTGALGNKRNLLLESSALAGVSIQINQLIAVCSDIMARLVSKLLQSWESSIVRWQRHQMHLDHHLHHLCTMMCTSKIIQDTHIMPKPCSGSYSVLTQWQLRPDNIMPP